MPTEIIRGCEMKNIEYVDTLNIAVKDLLPDSRICFGMSRGTSDIVGFVGIRALCSFDLQELKKSNTSGQLLSLLKNRLISVHRDLIDFAEDAIKQLSKK